MGEATKAEVWYRLIEGYLHTTPIGLDTMASDIPTFSKLARHRHMECGERSNLILEIELVGHSFGSYKFIKYYS